MPNNPSHKSIAMHRIVLTPGPILVPAAIILHDPEIVVIASDPNHLVSTHPSGPVIAIQIIVRVPGVGNLV